MRTRLANAKPRKQYPHIEVVDKQIVAKLQKFSIDLDALQRDVASSILELVLDTPELRGLIAQKMGKQR